MDIWKPPTPETVSLTSSIKVKLYPVFAGNPETNLYSAKSRKIDIDFVSGKRQYKANSRLMTEPVFQTDGGLLELEFFMFCYIFKAVTPHIELVVENVATGTLFGYKGAISIINKYPLKLSGITASELDYSSVTSELTPISDIGTNMLKCLIDSYVDINIGASGGYIYTETSFTPSIADIASFKILRLNNI
jgi:hypothetical protein